MADPYLRIGNLTKRFAEFTALDDVSIDVHQGEFVCFLGPSGCGKTTLLRYKQVVGQQNFQMGAVVSLILLLPGVLAFFVERWVQTWPSSTVSSRAVHYQPKPGPIRDWVLLALVSVVAVLILGILGMAAFASLAKLESRSAMVASHIQFHHLAPVFGTVRPALPDVHGVPNAFIPE